MAEPPKAAAIVLDSSKSYSAFRLAAPRRTVASGGNCKNAVDRRPKSANANVAVSLVGIGRKRYARADYTPFCRVGAYVSRRDRGDGDSWRSWAGGRGR